MRHLIRGMTILLRDAIRGLRAGRGTTFLACAIFALAIAAGTVTFTVVDTVALRPLPFSGANRLVAVPQIASRAGALQEAAPQDYFAWNGRVSAFESIAMYRNNIVQTTPGSAGPMRLSIARVTSNFFEVLRARHR